MGGKWVHIGLSDGRKVGPHKVKRWEESGST